MAPVKGQGSKPRRKGSRNRYHGQDLYKKFNFQLYAIGKDKKQHWFKFPKIEYNQRISLGRQIIHFDYTFNKMTMKSKRLDYVNWKEWNQLVDDIKKKPLFSRFEHGQQCKYWREKREPKDLIESIKAYGVTEEEATRQVTETFSKSAHDSSKFRMLGRGGFKSDFVGQDRVGHPRLTRTAIVPVRYGKDDIEDIRTTEEWQMANWVRPIQKEYFSVEVNEIFYNMRLFGLTVHAISSDARVSPPLTIVLLETLRNAYFNQEWYMVAKCIEGICIEASSPQGVGHRRHWMVWNAGFQSILRFEITKTPLQVAESVIKFAKNFYGICLPRCSPRRLAVEIAIWLTQEGYFRQGLAFLEEMDEFGIKHWETNRKSFADSINPKRDMIDLIANLIKAVNLYALWKRDCNLDDQGLFEGDEGSLERSGENALVAFESLLPLADKCEGEITPFLNQLIELTVECRSASKAKELFDELVIKHYGNAFVEKAYLNFLKKHFPDSRKKLCNTLKLKQKFQFKDPPHWKHESRAIGVYREKRAKQMEKKHIEKRYFKKLPNPEFSW